MRRFLSRHHSASPSSQAAEKTQTILPSPGVHWDSGSRITHEDEHEDDEQSTAALVAPTSPPPPPKLSVKRVDCFYSNWTKAWKYRNTSSKVRADALWQTVGNGSSGNGSDPWAGHCFVVVRKIPQADDGVQGEPTFQVVVKSPYLRVVCRAVMGKIRGVSWTAEPLEVGHQSAPMTLDADSGNFSLILFSCSRSSQSSRNTTTTSRARPRARPKRLTYSRPSVCWSTTCVRTTPRRWPRSRT